MFTFKYRMEQTMCVWVYLACQFVFVNDDQNIGAEPTDGYLWTANILVWAPVNLRALSRYSLLNTSAPSLSRSVPYVLLFMVSLSGINETFLNLSLLQPLSHCHVWGCSSHTLSLIFVQVDETSASLSSPGPVTPTCHRWLVCWSSLSSGSGSLCHTSCLWPSHQPP